MARIEFCAKVYISISILCFCVRATTVTGNAQQAEKKQTRMHSSRMRTVRSSSHPGGSPPGTPPGADPPMSRLPLGADPHPTPRSRPPSPGAGTSLETCCKACWDTTCNACWDTTPPVNRILDTHL